MPGAFEGETVTRRRLMDLTVNGAGAIAVGAMALPALGFALAPVFKRQSVPWQPIGPPGNFTEDTYSTVTVTIDATIGEAGKTIAYVRKRNPSIDTEHVDQYNQFVALSTRCMHLGC